MSLDLVLVLQLNLDGDITGVHLLAEDALCDTYIKPLGAQPPHVLGAQIALGDYANRLAQEAQQPPRALCEAHEVDRGSDALDHGQCRRSREMRAVEVAAQGIATAAGDMRHGHLLQCAASIWSFTEPVEYLVCQSVARTHYHNVVCVDIESLADVGSLAWVRRHHYVKGHLRGLENGLHVVFPYMNCASGASMGVYEDLGASPPLCLAICAVKERFDPCLGRRYRDLAERVPEFLALKVFLGFIRRVLDYYLVADGGPEDVIVREGALGWQFANGDAAVSGSIALS